VPHVDLSGEHRTTPSPRVRTVANVLSTNDTVDGPTAGARARWSIAGIFLEGLTDCRLDRPNGTAEPKSLMWLVPTRASQQA
jgi:hypothetical protein